MEPYLYFSGLKKLAKEVSGNEVVHIGIRPYGFHAGNAMALIVYPYLLCKYIEKEKKEPKLQFIISLNDWEQDALGGPDYRKYPFNIYPKNTSLQFTPDEYGCCDSVVNHWQPIIENSLFKLKMRFPGISLRFVRNSDLAGHDFFKDLLLETIRNPKEQSYIFKQYSGKDILDEPIQYAGAICPKCKRSHGRTTVTEENLVCWECEECGTVEKGKFDKFQYWWYHKPLLLARMEIFKIDVTLSGGDHFSEGDFKIREAFIKKYSPKTKEPKMLFTPTVIALDGDKMSKSRDNTAFADIEKLIKAVDNYDEENFYITQDLILDKIDEKNYSHIL